MAGLIIFPALFAMGESPSAGPALVFVVLPKLFVQMPGGLMVGTFFFLLLSVAALTSTISLLEVPVAYLVDEKNVERKKIVWAVAGFTFIVGLPSALSQGASEFFTNFGLLPERLTSADFLSQMSFIWGDFCDWYLEIVKWLHEKGCPTPHLPWQKRRSSAIIIQTW